MVQAPQFEYYRLVAAIHCLHVNVWVWLSLSEKFNSFHHKFEEKLK
jgi:hypothetical protein